MSNEVMTRNSERMNHIVNHLNRMVDNFERAVMNYRPMLGGERFMTDKELCARLQLSRRTLHDSTFVCQIIPLFIISFQFISESIVLT